MTTMTDPPKASFRLSMLLYDTRYRSITIQVIAMIGFMLGAMWLINNVRINLALAGKPFEFGFLFDASGYDINQKLIEYSSQSTHLRSAVVGFLNTLLVATLGCIAATVLGVFIGILRLSKNWIISRLATVYVETFRNVPLLLWISLAVVAFSHTLPTPRDFRGENPAASMSLFDSVAVTNRGIFAPEAAFESSIGKVPVFGNSFYMHLDWVAIFSVLIAGLLVSKLIARRAEKIQNQVGSRPTTWHWRLAVIVIPTVLVMWLLGFHLNYPEFSRFNFKGGILIRSSLVALWLALTLYTAAFIAEIVRAGIMAISKGQTEAAGALGIRPNKIMSLVVLPQAMRVIVPPLISQYLNLTKNSSLAVIAGYMDITGTLGGVTMNQTGREMESILLLMLCYLAISLSISTVMNFYNERTKLKER